MKSTVQTFLALLIGLAGGHYLRDAPLRLVLAEDEAPGESRAWNAGLRGDVNADGSLDLSDAMFILNYCFLEGTPPRELAVTQGRGLLETGQARCFDGDRGLELTPCPPAGADDFGQDGNYRTGIRRNFELVKVDENDPLTWYTIDHASGLMWQHRDEVRRIWRAALSHAEALELGGFDDWRLPNIREVLSIIDYGTRNPAIDEAFFHVIPTVYWSSTTSQFDGSRVFTVRFSEGLVGLHEKGQEGLGQDRFYSLAVRSID